MNIVIEVEAMLDLLPMGSVIVDDEGDAWQKFLLGWKVTGGGCENEWPTMPAKLIYSRDLEVREAIIGAMRHHE